MPIATKELKKLRKAKDLTQKQLAKSIDISPARYSSWERGEKQPSTEFVQKLASELGCSVSKLISQPKIEDVEEAFNDKHVSFNYFVHERESEEGHYYFSEELIIKLKLFEKPLNLILSNESRRKSINLLRNGQHGFVWLETVDDKMFYVNTSIIEWTILHNEAADEYPSISGNEFHETPLIKADVSKNGSLYMLAKNGNFDLGDCNFSLASDLAWLVSRQSKLIDEIPEVITNIKNRLGDNYLNFLNDTENSGYGNKFEDAWGIRIFLRNGQEIFLPGMTERGESWDEALLNIQDLNLYDDDVTTEFSDFENCNRYLIPTKEIALIEYPNVFGAMGLYYQFSGHEELDYDKVDSIIEKLHDQVWQK